MTRLRFSLCCVAPVVLVAAGCKKDATFSEPLPPQAAVHWMEAVPDTGEMDLRPIDFVSNAGLYDAVYRGSNMYYQGIDAGTHQIRVFMSSPDPTITSTAILDTSITFAAPNSYTVIHTGFARAGSTPGRSLWVIPDGAADPGANNVGIRIVNAGVGMGDVDVNLTRKGTDTLPDAPAIANLAYKGVSNYLTVARDTLVTGTDSLRIVVTAAGTKTPVLFSLKLQRGVAGSTLANPIAGATVAGSVMTAVIVPRSVLGSTAPQTAAFLTPTAVILVDRRPANTIQ